MRGDGRGRAPEAARLVVSNPEPGVDAPMQNRITTPQSKVTFVVLGYVAVTVATVFGALAANVTTAYLLYCVSLSIVIVTGSRLFRGEAEDRVAPRPVWRMTSKPTAGFVLTTAFVLQAVSTGVSAAVAPDNAPVYVFGVLFSLAIAAAYLNSSLRLLRGRENSGIARQPH